MMGNNYFKGIMAGVIVGAVVGMILDPMRSDKNTHSIKRKAGKVFRTAGNIIENFTDM